MPSRYPITDFNNLNVDWMIGQMSEQATDIDTLEAGVSANADAIAQEVLDRQAADAGLQYQIDNITIGTALVLPRTPNVNTIRQIVFVTDSFGSFPDAASSFVEECAANMNLQLGNWQKIYQAGSGFYLSDATKRFLTMIQNATITLIPDEVTDFVFVGGNNDLGAGLGDIRGQVVACAQWVQSNYPNAKVWVVFDAFRTLSGPDANASQTTQKAYQEGAAMEGAVYATVAPAMHGVDLIRSDGVHPTNSGVVALGKALSEVLVGSPNPTGGRSWAKVTGTPSSVVTALEDGWMMNSINGDMIEVFINPGYTWTVNSASWRAVGGNMWYANGHTWYDAATDVTAAFFNSPSLYPFTIAAPCCFECDTADGGAPYMNGFTMIRFTGGKIKCVFFGDPNRNAGTANEGWAKISKVHFFGGSWTLSALNN